MKYWCSWFKNKQFLFTLRVSISTVFLCIFLISALVTRTLNEIRFGRTVDYLNNFFMTAMTASILHQLSTLIDPIVPVVKLTKTLIEDKTVNTVDFNELKNHMVDVLETLPQVPSLTWGNANGSFMAAVREPNNIILIDSYNKNSTSPKRIREYYDANEKLIKKITNVKLDYDPRTRPWYQLAIHTTQPAWTNAYIFYVGGWKDLGISYAAKINQKDQPVSVISMDMKLDDLSIFLKNYKITKHSIAAIVDENGNIIAYPGLAQLINIRQNNAEKIVKINKIPNRLIHQAYNYHSSSHQEKFTFTENGTHYLASFTNIPGFFQYQWHIAIIVPEKDLIGSIQKLYQLIVGVMGLLFLIGLEAIAIFSKRISNPIKKLANELEEIRYLHIEPTPPVKTFIKEVHMISTAVQSMKAGLRSFLNYVPEDLVRQLIASGEAAKIGGNSRYLTLFFSDIANFTTISENVGPEKIMQYLCEYFDELTEIISQNKGTVDKYIGDGIMAFWGAPIKDELSIEHACSTALFCQSHLTNLNKKWQERDRIIFNTRIGIHYGEVVVGNLGSSHRLNYTAIGDPVNVTSRLEQLNKIYQTKIIVSEQVVNEVREKFLFRILDRIVVKGRHEPICIYELIQTKPVVNDQLQDFCDIYLQGINAYQFQDWDKAINYFEMALKIYDQDTPSKIMLNRCYYFKKNPPTDWNGIWIYS